MSKGKGEGERKIACPGFQESGALCKGGSVPCALHRRYYLLSASADENLFLWELKYEPRDARGNSTPNGSANLPSVITKLLNGADHVGQMEAFASASLDRVYLAHGTDVAVCSLAHP